MSILLLLSLLSLAFCRVEIENKEFPHEEDEYIITYHTNTTDDEATVHWALMESVGVVLKFKFSVVSHHGFSAKITDQKVLAALQEDPLVKAIQVNGYAYAIQTCDSNQAASPSWGLARVSHVGDVSRGLTGRYSYNKAGSGAGVSVYVLDTGVLTTHTDFGGRAVWGASFNGAQRDGNGHGTHCAGTIGGTVYGVAKEATIVAVKVLSDAGSGTWDQVISGVNWVTTNGRRGFAVASMSLGGTGSNTALTEAINALVSAGIPCVVAAGNSGADACNYTPAGITSVISVGATEIAGSDPTEFDNRASFSNYGRCTHVYAPGRNILSAWIDDNSDSHTISGTSMACPHVAGYVAGLLSVDSSLSPDDLKSAIQTNSQKNLIQNIGAQSPNNLLYNGCNV